MENQNDDCYYDGGDCCNQTLVGNLECNKINFFKTCGFYDGGECCAESAWRGRNHIFYFGDKKNSYHPALIGDGICNIYAKNVKYSAICYYDGGDCCDQNEIGDGVCQNYNNFATCGNFDGGDCIDKYQFSKSPCIFNGIEIVC